VWHLPELQPLPVIGLSMWAATCAPDIASAAIAVARQVAARLCDQTILETTNRAPGSWEPHGVAQGDAGLAIMCGYLDACFPDEGWDTFGHRWLTSAAHEAERADHLPIGLFDGVSGLGLAAWLLSRDGRRYSRLLASIDRLLVPRTVQLARSVPGQRHGLPVGDFDVISGATGIGAYLLHREGRREVDAVRAILRSLIALTDDREGIPRWHTPPEAMRDATMLREHPGGALNCGLAHGIPGPLALMALALREGFAVDGLEQAVERTASWLARQQVDDAWGMNWPTVVPLTSNARESAPRARTGASRSAWCYGSPGIARSLWLAGDALHDPWLKALAVEAIQAVYRRPLPIRNIGSPTFCHGVAGLLHITLRFSHDTGLALFAQQADVLLNQLLALHDPDRLFGYAALEPGGRLTDEPGLLEGAAGVVMTLLASSTDREPSWDRLFLLS
jgi:lantibiotic biosynthesis protein